MIPIVWSKIAENDLDEIWTYIAAHSELNAHQFIAKLVRSIQHLASLPNTGRVVPETSSVDIREVLFNDYRLIYRIKDQQILILTVVHGSRNISDLVNKFKSKLQ